VPVGAPSLQLLWTTPRMGLGRWFTSMRYGIRRVEWSAIIHEYDARIWDEHMWKILDAGRGRRRGKP